MNLGCFEYSETRCRYLWVPSTSMWYSSWLVKGWPCDSLAGGWGHHHSGKLLLVVVTDWCTVIWLAHYMNIHIMRIQLGGIWCVIMLCLRLFGKTAFCRLCDVIGLTYNIDGQHTGRLWLKTVPSCLLVHSAPSSTTTRNSVKYLVQVRNNSALLLVANFHSNANFK